jgi:hypothetical protein
MTELSLFIPLTKIDEEKRLVYGIATAEVEDRTGEVCDYATTKPYYEKWSSDVHKSSNGKSMGNLRSMHGKVAAGKITDISFDDTNKKIEICAKVVDDQEWKKVLEGVYTGFSQGGSYIKRWDDPENPAIKRYTADPTEVSLVDLPCLKTATFEVIKADGHTEMRKFHTKEATVSQPTNDDVAAKAVEMAKVAGDETTWANYIEAAREELTKANAPTTPLAKEVIVETPAIDNDVKQVWQARDGKTFAKKAEVVAYHKQLDTDEMVKAASAPALAALDKLNDVLNKKDYSDNERKEMAAKGEAKPDGSYPIKNIQDLKNAIKTWGRGDATQSDKDHIKERAKALGATAELPEDWGGAPDKTVMDNLGKGGGDTAPDGDTFDHKALSDMHRQAAKDFADKAKDHASDGNAKQASIHRDNARSHDDAADMHDRANVLQSSNHPDADKASKDAFSATDMANSKTGTAIKCAKMAEGKLQKGLPTVAELAYLIERFKVVASAVHMEAKQENDGSTVPDKMKTNIKDLCDTLNEMCQEETAELIQGQNVDDLNNVPNVFNMAAGLAEGRFDALVKYVGTTTELEKFREPLEKVGAAISAANLSKIQQAHDALIELGAICGGKDIEGHSLSGDGAKKHVHVEDMTKVIEQRDALQKSLDNVTSKLETVITEVEKLKAQPVSRPNYRVVSKGEELGLPARDDAGMVKAINAMSSEEKAAMLIKLSQTNPLHTMGRGMV